MPPYDEQTQAFIDGEGSLGLGGRGPCPSPPPLPVPAGAHDPGPTWSSSKTGGWGLGRPAPPPSAPWALLPPHRLPLVGATLSGGEPEGPWEPRAWAVSGVCPVAGRATEPSFAQCHPEQAWGWGSRCVRVPPSPFSWVRVGVPLTSPLPPAAAQEARNKFEEAERSLRDMEESIRYGVRVWPQQGSVSTCPTAPAA